MKQVLHITNNESSAESLLSADIGGIVIDWLSELYIGPLLPLPLEDLIDSRAAFLGEFCEHNYDDLQREYREKVTLLRRFREFDEIVLWFDHNLSSQLQLIHLLNWFAQQSFANTELSLICINQYPGVYGYTGLTSLNSVQISSLFKKRSEVTLGQLNLGKNAWDVLTGDDPRKVQRFYTPDFSSLPFLKDALSRFLDDFPSQSNGLSRTQRLVMQLANSNISKPQHLRYLFNKKEDRPFWSMQNFWREVKAMMSCDHPLILTADYSPLFDDDELIDPNQFKNKKIFMTEIGHKVLRGKRDHLQLNGIDRWIGGVHLRDNNIWRRNNQFKRIKKTYA